MKKIVIGIVTLVFLLGMVTFADEIVELFNFDALKEKAVDSSLALQSSLLSLESKELSLEEVNKDAFNANQLGGDRVTYINNMIKVHSDTLIAQMNVELATMALAKEEENIKEEIYKKGMSYLLLLDEIALNEKVLEFKELYKGFTKQKVASGISTSTELVNKTIDVQSQEMKLLELTASLEAIKIEINHLLGEELDADLLIEDNIIMIPFREYVIEYEYLDRVDKYPAVYAKSETYKSKEINFNLYDERYVEADKEYKIALYNQQIAEIELSDAKKSFEVSIRSTYNNYLNAYDSYLLSVKQNELSTKLYDDAKFKYDLGVINKEELLNAEEAKLNSDFSVTKAIYNYNVSRTSFNNLY